MDIKPYLERINYQGSLTPSFEVLCNLQQAHLLNVPFENLDIHLNTKITLSTDNFYKKIVINKRGGFCYELNGLYNELLIALGFATKIISARVYSKEKGYGEDYDHLALIVTINNTEYLTDVGFGEFTFTPLKLAIREHQKDERGNYMLDIYEDYHRVSKIINCEEMPQYIFKNSATKLKEFNEMSRYHQTNENSHFTQKRLISLPTVTGRITITNNVLKISDNGFVKEILLKDEMEFHRALLNYFEVKIANEPSENKSMTH